MFDSVSSSLTSLSGGFKWFKIETLNTFGAAGRLLHKHGDARTDEWRR